MMIQTTPNKIPPIVYLFALIFLIASFSIGQSLLNLLGIRQFFNTHDSLANRHSSGDVIFSEANATEPFRSGIQLFRQGKYAKAQAEFQLAALEAPDNPVPFIYAQNAELMKQPHLKIAAVVPLGSNRNVALEMLKGIALAQKSFNENGGQLVVEIFNDDNEPDLAKKVASHIVQETLIKAVVGHNASNAALYAAPIYQKAGVVMITPTSFANELSGAGDYIFRTTPSIRHLAGTLASYSVNTTRRKKVAVCYDSDAGDNLSFKEEFVNSLIENGGQLIPTDCNFSSPSFDAQSMVSKLISDGADAVLLTPHIDRLDRLMDLSRANRWRMALMGSPSLETQKNLDIGQGDINGVVIPVPYHQDMAAAQSFVVQAKQQFQSPLTWRTFTSMDAMQAILQESTLSDSRQSIQKRLRKGTFHASGSAGAIRFLPTGDRIGHGVLVQIKPQAEGYAFKMLTSHKP